MERLSFLADEHVPNVVVTALRSNGYAIETAKDHLGAGAADIDLLRTATALGRVLLTNDRDFVSLGKEVGHAGIVVYITQELAPGRFVQAIRLLNRYFTPQTMKNNIEGLDDWLR